MNEPQPSPEPADFYAEVHPGGILGQMLDNIANPRKHRWNKYLRACKAIPKSSPVAGSTSFKRINQRRLEIIHAAFSRDDPAALASDPEKLALSKAVDARCAATTAGSSFLMGRLLRRLQKKHPRT